MAQVMIKSGQVLDLSTGEARERAPDDEISAHICRRLADFTVEHIPPIAARAPCSMCEEIVLHNPATPTCAPKICLQCAGFEPLPTEMP